MFHSITASRTTPTLWVFVIKTGVPKQPDSSSQAVPVISPLPFMLYHAPNTLPRNSLPCGKIAVTPVLTGPFPITRDQSCVTDGHALHIRDGIEMSRIPFEGYSQVSRTNLGLRQTIQRGS